MNTLLTIEVALFGISAATIIVFLQLAYSNLTSRQITAVFHQVSLRIYLILYSIFGLLTLAITVIGSLRTAYPQSDLLPGVDLGSSFFISFDAMILSYSLMFLSTLFFLLLVRSGVSYLQPSSFLALFTSKVDFESIRLFLFRKYGIQSPDKAEYHKNVLDTLPEERRSQIIQQYKEDGKLELSQDETRTLEEHATKEAETLEADLRMFNRLVESAKEAINPLEPVFEVALQSLQKGDLLTFREAQDALCKTSQKFIGSFHTKKPGWNPESGLVKNYSNLMMEQLQMQTELSRRQKLESAYFMSLDTSFCLANASLASNDISAVYLAMSFWKNKAYQSIGESDKVFKKIIDIYRQVAMSILGQSRDLKDRPLDHILDEAFRNLGWLGEKLFAGKVLEPEPLMYDSEYYTEYDALLNCLYEIRSEYEHRHANSYPLVFFDAIMVVLNAATQAFLADRKNTKLKHMLYDLPNTFYRFADKAIATENGDGAMWAVIQLIRSYQDMIQKNLGDQASDIADMLIRLTGTAISKKSDLDLKNRWNTDIDIWIMKELENASFAYIRSGDVVEVYTHSAGMGKHDEIWAFIKQLGVKMGTNFGFMFDHETGEDYPEEDPRRR